MQCFACTREAIQRCPRCGNAYCEGHGADFCAACLDPLNAAPSRSTFRIALLGFLGGCVLALWLLVRPPDVPGQGTPIIRNEGPTASPGLTPAGAAGGASGSVTPVPSAATTPQPTNTGPAGSATATPAGSATPTPAPTDTPGPLQYVVQEGDTWFGIAEAFGVDVGTLAAFNGRVGDDNDFLHAGETLLIPQ